MVIDSPLTFGLTVGADRRIPQEGDSQVIVPALVLPIALMAQPHSALNSSASFQGSGIIDVTSTLTNGAGIATTFMTLAPGLWELEINMASVFNFVGSVGTMNGAKTQLLYQTILNDLATLTAQIGSQSIYVRWRLLLVSVATLIHALDTNTVGQTTTSSTTVSAIRIL